MPDESLQELMDEFAEVTDTNSNEGSTGVKNLCRLVRALGYKDETYFGQFHPNASYGDLINFLEDNSGCVEAIKEWIANQDMMEWAEELETYLPEKEEDDEDLV